MAITLAKQGHNPELWLKKIGFEVDEMVQHVKSWVKDSIHSWLMLLLCKRHVYRCMTLTLLPSCCTPNPWWNSMCLKWRTYLPLNEWLQRLNFTRLKEYQLAAWMPSEKKKNKARNLISMKERFQELLSYTTCPWSVSEQLILPSVGTEGAQTHYRCPVPGGWLSQRLLQGSEEMFGSLVLPDLYDRLKAAGNSWSSSMLTFNLCWTIHLVYHRIS